MGWAAIVAEPKIAMARVKKILVKNIFFIR
jgi:hypothetical protein